MSFKSDYLQSKKIQKVLHVGADRGGELPQYSDMKVDEVVWVEANPEVYGELLENLQIRKTDMKFLILVYSNYLNQMQIKSANPYKNRGKFHARCNKMIKNVVLDSKKKFQMTRSERLYVNI